MDNNNNVPEIRFEGFNNPWEQRKLGEVFDCTIPNNTLSRAELNYESGSVRNIHYGDILIKYGSIVDVQNDEIPFATGKSRDDFKGALLQDGDIIIADTAEDETTGKVCEIGNSQGLDVVSGLHTMVCRPRNKMALGYLGYYLNSDAYHHQLLPIMQGIKVLSLGKTNVQKTMVCYPKSKVEQQLIADYFRNLDHLITLHQCKYEKLLDLKKSMLYKLFPKEEETVPEIRFDGYSRAWEKKKLGDCFSERIESFPEGELLSVTINSGIKKFSDLERINNSNENKTKYKKVHVGDIAYNSMRMWQGASGYSPFEGIVSPAYTVLNPKEGIDSKCFAYLFKRTDIIHMFQLYSKGITSDNWNLKYSDFKELEVYVSCDYNEQKAIGKYFSELDKLIELNREKLGKLKNIKSSLLDKMFV